MAAEMIQIDDPDDERLADFIGLRDRELRTRADSQQPEVAVFIAEGDIVVERALRAGYELRALLVDATRESLPVGLPTDAAVYGAGREVVTRITGMGVHRGSMGVFLRRELPSPAAVMAGARRLVVAEGVVNPINLGVIIRSAAGLGMDGLLLDSASVDPLYRRASRVSMGEVFDLPYSRIGSLPDALDDIVAAGFTTVALTPDATAESLDEISFTSGERVALVLGSEGPGLTDETMQRCDRRVRIPLSGRVDSLNVGSAAAVAFYAISRC